MDTTPENEPKEIRFPEAMKAVVTTHYNFENPVEVLKYVEDWPFPLGSPGKALQALQQVELSPTQVLIKLKYSAVNPVDFKINEGVLKLMISPPLVGGRDASGVVLKAGSEAAKTFKEGDAVLGYMGLKKLGTYAEYSIFEQNELVHKPESIEFDEGAAMMLVLTTVWECFQCHKSTASLENASVLVHGGSSGTGPWGLVLAKHYFKASKVYTTCSEKNFDYVKKLGATRPINYNTENFADVIRREEEGRPLTFVLDCVGGSQVMDGSLELLDGTGTFVTIAMGSDFESNPSISGALGFGSKIAWQKLKSVFSNSPSCYMLMAKPDGPALQPVVNWVGENGFQKSITLNKFPLAEVAAAHSLSISRRAVGKIVIDISN